MKFLELFISSIPKVPWRGYIMGLFLPLMLLHIGKQINLSILFFHICLIWCVLFFLVDFYLHRCPCIFPLITFFMVLTQFLAGYYAAVHPSSAFAMSIVPGLDNGLMSVIFLVSLLTKKPLILFLIEKDTIERMPEKIKATSFFVRTWEKVTLVWGIAFVIQSMLLTYLKVANSNLEAFLDFVFSWPLILVLLFFSVMYPRWYWTKNYSKIEEEYERDHKTS